MFGSRAKGSRAELEVAALLQAWWKSISSEAIFKRVPLSGGWGDPEARGKFRSAGDIMTSCPKWPFVVEVKRRDHWSWKPFLAGKPSPIWGWWKQACKAADELKESGPAVPLLIFRKSREPWQVVLPFYVYQKAKVDVETLVRCRANAWYPDQLGERAGKIFPISTTLDDFLAHRPEEWIRTCATEKIR